MTGTTRGPARSVRTAPSARPARPVAHRPGPLPADPGDRLELPVGLSTVPAASVLHRHGPRLGILTVRDLLFHLPRRYDDLRELHDLSDLGRLEPGTVVSARARVVDVAVSRTWRRRVQATTARLRDATGEAEATWFGRRFIERRLHVGDEVIVSGRLKRGGVTPLIDNPDFQRADDETLLHAGRIVPVYGLTQGLTAVRLRAAVRGALDLAGDAYPEYLPESLRRSEALGPIGDALEQAHFPSTFETLAAALRRLAYDELLALQLGMVARRRARGHEAGLPIEARDAELEQVRDAIRAALRRRLGEAVELTTDQVDAISAIRTDLGSTTPMLRLLQGDVGSGKTAVAAAALALTALAGHQGVLLAPTDLLARQHLTTIGELLADLGIEPVLLVGALSAAGRRNALEAIADGRAGIVVATHAVLEEAVAFRSLALAVIDEQHRFGVEQRGRLEAKAGGRVPHVLLMTATPIPRTLGQVLYADLEVSNLHTPPAGRLAIGTGIRHPAQLDRLWDFVRQTAGEGQATFVVVPAIEDNEGSDVVAAKSEAARLQALLPGLRVGLVHGQMKAADRDRALGDLRDGALDVLVGTTVLEVGVDVPRATLMVIESADRFGLAQLHQLRGRVGRGDVQSYCALVSDAAASTEQWQRLVDGRREPETTEQARLVAVARTTDGFALAEKDWELRGEGDVLGLVQSGLPGLRVATLARADHRALAVDARTAAEALLGPSGEFGADTGALRHELEHGWLARVWKGEPESGA